MFRRFVQPALTRQCAWLDYSLFHLDGTQAIPQLDNLLSIEPLRAIEWTPQAGLPGGGSPRWYDLYRRIRAAGKSVQAIGVRPEEVEPLLDAVGAEGMFVMVAADDEDQALEVIRRAGAVMRPVEIMRTVVLVAVAEIGRDWEAGLVTVAQEHFASHLARRFGDRLMDLYRPAAGLSPVLCACAPGEQHDLGLLAVAMTRGEEVMHAVAAVTTLVVLAIWLNGYPSGSLTSPPTVRFRAQP